MSTDRRVPRQAAAEILAVERLEVRPDLLVISAAGEIDTVSVRALQHETWQELAPVTVLDLSRVTFLGAAGLRVLGQTAQRARVEGWRLCFVVPPRPVSMVLLSLWNDDSVLLYPTLSEALQANPE
ncbi:STAS domain-containing protein [Amycolatopsis sp. NPDC004378]